MSVYQVTIQIESDTRIERLREVMDRIILHTFGSSGSVENFIEVDCDGDPMDWTDTRTIQDEATDEHNEAVARAAGARTYTRTDGKVVAFGPTTVVYDSREHYQYVNSIDLEED